MGRIIFDQESFSFEEIKETIPAEPETDFASALLFCHEWLNGKDSFLLHTSGSTGQPKPIVVSRAQMEFSARGTALALGLKEGDTALVCLNTAYIAGLMMLVRGMVIGMDLIVVKPYSSPLRQVRKEVKIDFAAFVPLQLQTILGENDVQDKAILEKMKAIIVGGAAVSKELEVQIQLLSAPVFITYGMTETVSHIALRRLNGSNSQEYYKTLPEVSIETDERGALKILSPVTKQQWLQTNDVVEIIGPDQFRWLGRADHTINSGGLKIQPEKIELQLEQILSENGINHFFIAGLPHSLLGQAVTLFIESTEKTENQLLEKIRPLLNRYELPKAIVSLKIFPRTVTGKIERAKIMNEFNEYYS